MKNSSTSAYALAVTLSLVACGGGGGQSTTPAAPGPSNTPGSAVAQFVIGAGQNINGKRKPHYLPPTAQSVAVYIAGVQNPDLINITQGSSGCTGTAPNLVCTLNVSSPVGSDLFQIIAYDQPNGNGVKLSQTFITVDVKAGTNVVHAVLNGIVSQILLGNVNLPEAVATSVPLPIALKDADGNVIVGPGAYDVPVTLGDSDTSGGTSLTTKTLSQPGQIAAVNYDGHSEPNGSISAATDAVSAQSGGTLRIVPQYDEYPIPSGRYATGAAVLAPDGSLWFGESGTPFGVASAIGHSTTSGQITEYGFPAGLGLPSYASAGSMVMGPDGNIWYLSPLQYGGGDDVIKMDLSGNFTVYSSGVGSRPQSMTIGPDGGMWYSYRGGIGEISTSGAVTNYPAPLLSGTPANFGSIVTGPDRNLWVTQGSVLYRVTTNGQYTAFQMPVVGGVGITINGIAASSSVLYVFGSDFKLYTISTSSGVATVLQTYNTQGIAWSTTPAIASNGAVWLATGQFSDGNFIERVSSTGVLDSVTIPLTQAQEYPNTNGIVDLTATPDAHMWFVLGTDIGRIVVR